MMPRRGASKPMRETKPCTVCGREIQWRKKWERDWASVKYCSDRCRKAGTGPIDARLEAAIIALLSSRERGATICPSEAARAVAADGANAAAGAWRDLMEPARAAARRLHAHGLIRITQQAREVDPSTAKGPIRLGLLR